MVHVVLTVEDETLHRSHFELRAEAQTRGPSARYLEQLPTHPQAAGSPGRPRGGTRVPVIRNVALDDALGELLSIVLAAAEVDRSADARPPRP